MYLTNLCLPLKVYSTDQETMCPTFAFFSQMEKNKFGERVKKLPHEFEGECFMEDNEVETFLREKLNLDVREVQLIPTRVMFENPRFRIILN